MFLFSSCNLDLDPVTLVYERDLDILKMYQHLKREVSRSRFSKVCAWRVHTDRPTERSTTPHSRLAKVVTIANYTNRITSNWIWRSESAVIAQRLIRRLSVNVHLRSVHLKTSGWYTLVAVVRKNIVVLEDVIKHRTALDDSTRKLFNCTCSFSFWLHIFVRLHVYASRPTVLWRLVSCLIAPNPGDTTERSSSHVSITHCQLQIVSLFSVLDYDFSIWPPQFYARLCQLQSLRMRRVTWPVNRG